MAIKVHVPQWVASGLKSKIPQLLNHAGGDAALLQQFYREAGLACSLHFPHVVRVYGISQVRARASIGHRAFSNGAPCAQSQVCAVRVLVFPFGWLWAAVLTIDTGALIGFLSMQEPPCIIMQFQPSTLHSVMKERTHGLGEPLCVKYAHDIAMG